MTPQQDHRHPPITGHLCLVGAGKMGGAMLDGWLEGALKPDQVSIMDPALSADYSDLLDALGLAVNPDLAARPAISILLLAVKPQIMDQVLPLYTERVGPDTLVISVAAGLPLSAFESAFGADKAIVRCMPNTPAAVGQGMSVLCANDRVTPHQREIAFALLSAVGEVAWIEREADMDAVTGVSGSGPAYVFHMIEAMTEAGIAEGLSPDLARQLARTTVAGSGALVIDSEEEAATLRENVTSPNGTTYAGLQVLMDEETGLRPLLRKTVKAAAERSRELGKAP